MISLQVQAAELVTLSPENYAEYVPQGKEVDAVVGDWVLRNDKIVAAVGDANFKAVRGRSTSRHSKAPTMVGRIIDLTTRSQPNDLLDQLEVAFLPKYGNQPRGVYQGAATRQGNFFDSAKLHTLPGREAVNAPRVQLHLPWVGLVTDVTYTLEDGWPYVLLEVELANAGKKPVSVPLPTVGGLFLGPQGKDQPFAYGFDAAQNLHWAYDQWFGQAYGSLAEPGAMAAGNYALKPGEKLKITKRIFPARDLLGVRAVANQILGVKTFPVRLEVIDLDGVVAGADVAVYQQIGPEPDQAAGEAAPTLYAAGRTDDRGVMELQLPAGPHKVVVASLGRPDQAITVEADKQPAHKMEVDRAGYVAAQISDEGGKPIPCKVEFRGLGSTPDPFFFPETGEHLVRNLVYTLTGRFRQAVPPGEYEAVITHGPEYDAVFQKLSVARGQETTLRAALSRVVDTKGWVSADFGNRSTGSRPFSTASRMGRVLNLIAENIEFAPATERDTISTFKPLLEKLNAKHLLATSDGIGLTQRRKGHNDYNSFPVRYVPGALDGGAPQRPQHILMLFWLNAWYGPNFEKELQWQPGSEKLIQVNPPQVYPSDGRWDGMWRYFDDRRVSFEQVDRGGRFEELRHMDAMELQPLDAFLRLPPFDPADPKGERDILKWWDDLEERERVGVPNVPDRNLDWMRMLNLGYRFTGVVNSNAYYNFHGSGGCRTYVKSLTDDPGKIEALEIVRQIKAGHALMTTGPFVEVHVTGAAHSIGGAGDDVSAPGGKATLSVRVQSSNWCRVERVQVLFNGRPVPRLTFTRDSHPQNFMDGVVQFDQKLPLELEQDTHIIVLADGKGPNLRDRQAPPVRQGSKGIKEGGNAPVTDAPVTHVAMTNPVWVDTDGDGFHPSRPFNDKVYARMDCIEPLLSTPGSEPARVRVTMKNWGKVTASDTFTVQILPEGAATVVGDNLFSYSIAPGEVKKIEFQVALVEGGKEKVTIPKPTARNRAPLPSVRLYVPRSSAGIGRHTMGLSLEIDPPPEKSGWKRPPAPWLPEQVRDRPKGLE